MKDHTKTAKHKRWLQARSSTVATDLSGANAGDSRPHREGWEIAPSSVLRHEGRTAPPQTNPPEPAVSGPGHPAQPPRRCRAIRAITQIKAAPLRCSSAVPPI
ncbi:hypothetical protein JZ751_007351 [Albula glossodonta]|uniref:Uncharacterized protein n=1 Tax=Albula glossodonta TaxID=121402 RepID=A0A8T2MU64_9TELE|nr:hypothetical protein JZ751_007351 [Albula glossodonta]